VSDRRLREFNESLRVSRPGLEVRRNGQTGRLEAVDMNSGRPHVVRVLDTPGVSDAAREEICEHTIGADDLKRSHNAALRACDERKQSEREHERADRLYAFKSDMRYLTGGKLSMVKERKGKPKRERPWRGKLVYPHAFQRKT